MAKQRHQEPTSSKGSLIVLTIGALLVAGLVVWALTRTVEQPSTAAITETSPGTFATDTTPTPSTPAPTTAATPTPDATATGTPLASATAPITLTSTTPPAAPAGDRSVVKRISAEDLRERMKSGNVVIVDVRDAGSYQTSHIAGAIHVPMSSIQANLDLIPKGKDVVTYCT
ncbi:MAG TPA: rhodanese-like domain-containing protein [Thermoanaerobaculia bacterium]|nr:rhodanese-like domain-containing protein [Thermoanaerobaculia bacterium]